MADIPSVDALPTSQVTLHDDEPPIPKWEHKHTDHLEASKEAPEYSRDSSVGRTAVEDKSPTPDTLADEKANADGDPMMNQTLAPRPKPWVFWMAFASMLCCAFLYGLDTTIAADVQASIYKSLGEISKIAWVGIGFPLGSAGTILPIGAAYGKFDLKKLFIGGLVLFEGGSALCGGAPNMDALIIGRVIAGIGGCTYSFSSSARTQLSDFNEQAQSTLEG